MKICVLYRSFFGESGGAGVNTYLRNLKKHLEVRGHQVYFIASNVEENEEKRFYQSYALCIYPLRAFTGDLTFMFSSLFKLIKLNNKYNFDVIYAVDTSGTLGYLIKKHLKKPVVNHFIYPGQSRFYSVQNKITNLKQYIWFLPLIPLEKIALVGADKIITLTEDHKKEIVKHNHENGEKIVVIPNGVDTPKIMPIHRKTDGFFYLFVGRARKEKGIQELIKAFNLLKVNKKRLVIVGEASDEVKRIYGGKNIIFTGYISDRGTLGTIYQNSDVFVLPTYWEGQSVAVLEAMSYGLPVIATDIPGMRSLIETEKNGFLVPPWDATPLAEKMDLITKRDYKKMGEYSREKTEKEFSWSSVAERTVKVFEDAIKEYER